METIERGFFRTDSEIRFSTQTLVIKYVETSSIGKRISGYNKISWKKDIKSEDIDFNNPVVLCLGGAGVNDDRSANGVAKIAQTTLGRIGVKNDEIQIFSAKYPEKKDVDVEEQQKSIVIETSNYINDIYKIVLKPALYKNKETREKRSKEDISKILRNITIFAHCHGSFVADKIINFLKRDMIYSGFKPKEIKEMLSEITTIMLSPRAGVEKNNLSLNLGFTLASDNLGGNITFPEYKKNKDIDNFFNKFINNKIKGNDNFCIKYNDSFYNFWSSDTFGADLTFRESRDADYIGSASNNIVHDSLFMGNDFHLIEQYYNPYAAIKDERSGGIYKNEKASNLTKIMIKTFQNAVSLSVTGEKRTINNVISNDTPVSYEQGEKDENIKFIDVKFDKNLDTLLSNYKRNKLNHLHTIKDLIQNQK